MKLLMKILHVLSHSIVKGGKVFTGADKYALTLIEAQIRQGHQIFMTADHLAGPTKAEFFQQGIGQRRFYERIANVLFVRRLISRKAVELVNAHSRAASWVSFWAVCGTGIPLISTVHGRQKIHFSTRTFDIYGDLIIAVCENIKDHLIRELGIRSGKIVVVPNGIDFSEFPETLGNRKRSSHPHLAFIGRTTGEKGNKTAAFIETVVPVLRKQFPEMKICHVGGDPKRLALGEIGRKLKESIEFHGHVAGINSFLADADVVVGSGRVAIESLACGIPTVALGESCCHGFVTRDTLPDVLKTNFGDILPQCDVRPVDFKTLASDITTFFEKGNHTENIRAELQGRFDVSVVQSVIQNVYQRARLMRKAAYIPVLMYHKIPKESIVSRHRTFVPMDQFERHLGLLKKWGCTALTFRDYQEYRSGKKPFAAFPRRPVIITFDDGYLDNYENAFPLLKKYGFRAVIFAMCDQGLRHNAWDAQEGERVEPLMTIEQIREMSDWGIEFGAHTLSHLDLTKASVEAASREIALSRRNLQEWLGKPVLSFAYPYGRSNETVRDLVREAGFSFGVSTDSGGVTIEEDPMQIFRIHIFSRDRSWEFFKKMTCWYRWYVRWKRGA